MVHKNYSSGFQLVLHCDVTIWELEKIRLCQQQATVEQNNGNVWPQGITIQNTNCSFNFRNNNNFLGSFGALGNVLKMAFQNATSPTAFALFQ